jgi:hypothetical protein
MIVVQLKVNNISAISWWEQFTFQRDQDCVHFVLDQQGDLDFYCASSLKQQSADRHVTPLESIYTAFYDKVCQWLVADQWFSLGIAVSSTNKTAETTVRG